MDNSSLKSLGQSSPQELQEGPHNRPFLLVNLRPVKWVEPVKQVKQVSLIKALKPVKPINQVKPIQLVEFANQSNK